MSSTPEILHTCPACQRSGFTGRGLKAHECRALGRRLTPREQLAIAGHGPKADLPTAPLTSPATPEQAPSARPARNPATPSPMPKPAKKSSALALVSSADFKVAPTATKTLKALAIDQVAAVAQLETQAAAAAIIAGLNLHRTKASLPHGQFVPFLEKELAKSKSWSAATAKKNASYYMRLSSIFVEASDLREAAIIAALNGDTGKAGSTFSDALRRFTADHSLTELLIKHDIKSVGLKSTLAIEAGEESADDDADLTPEQKLERACNRAWEDSWTAIQRVRAALTEPEQIQLLTNPQHIERLHAEAVEIARIANDRLAALRTAKTA